MQQDFTVYRVTQHGQTRKGWKAVSDHMELSVAITPEGQHKVQFQVLIANIQGAAKCAMSTLY